jgi:glucoamylase
MLIDEFIFGNTALLPTIWDYVHAQAKLQTVSNPSGTFLPQGLGLAEPKYQVDGTRFNGAWGRPQRDGPALRAIALMTFSNWLIDNGQKSTAKTIVWPIISNDLSKKILNLNRIFGKSVGLTLECRLRRAVLEPNRV